MAVVVADSVAVEVEVEVVRRVVVEVVVERDEVDREVEVVVDVSVVTTDTMLVQVSPILVVYASCDLGSHAFRLY